MNFDFSPEERALLEEARAFADDVCAPGALERDLDHAYPEAQVKAAAEKGYLGLLVPEKYGGRDLGNMGQSIVLEEIARTDPATHVTLSVHNSLATGPIKEWGSEELKQKYLPKLATGELIGAYALTEPQSGSDAAAMNTTAVRDGDEWVLNGTKIWITTGAQADVAVVFARTNPDVPKAKGISAFVVDLHKDGVSCGKPENKLGMRASQTVQLFLDEVRIPADHILGELDKGFNYALTTLNGGRVGIAVQAIGIAQGAFDHTLREIAKRDPAKGSALGTQDQEFRLSVMATHIDAARLLTHRAARLRDEGRDHMREASMAKLMASKTANEVCREGVDLLGQYGWQAVAGVERFLRDARVTEIYEGTTEIQKLVIARSLASEVR